jgi:hypothetical protein
MITVAGTQALTLGTVVAYSLIGTARRRRGGTGADHRHPPLTEARTPA